MAETRVRDNRDSRDSRLLFVEVVEEGGTCWGGQQAYRPGFLPVRTGEPVNGTAEKLNGTAVPMHRT